MFKKQWPGRIVLVIFIILFLSLILTPSVQAGSIFIFNKNLQIGSINPDVKEMQKFLNNNGFALSNSGVGSPGQETTFFGLITRNALIKFQKANKIIPSAGFFGPATRRVFNKTGKLLVKNEINHASPASAVSSSRLVNQISNNQPESKINSSTDQNIKGNYYTIGGSVTGIVGPVVLQNNGKDDLIIDINQNSNFTFPGAMIDGANYNITVKSQSLDQTCYARDNVGVINGADINNIKIACGAKLSYNPFTYILSGSNAAPRINTYSVNFSANGSTDGTIPSSQTKTQDVMLVLSANSGTLIKTGYTFSGWNTAADGTGTDYAAGANYTNNTDITLYAKWIVAAPSALSFNSPNLFIVNTAISTISPAVSGSVDSYSVSPSLPAGLSLNTTNGQITGTPTASTTQSTYTVTATNAGGSTTFELVIMVDGTVVGANGKIWLDRNLGAKQAATSSADYLAYGDLFQWGRAADGHQVRTSSATSTNSAGDDPGHDNFILEPNSPFDWRSSQNNNLWQGANSTNNPCPAGFRLPTETEWTAERLSWSFNNSLGAFNSPLKLTSAGYRVYNTGALSNVGSYGIYWSSVAIDSQSRTLVYTEIAANMSTNYRSYGVSVRCTANSYSVFYNDNGSTGGTKPANQTKTHDVALALATNSGTLVKTGYTFSGWNTASDGTGTNYAVGADYITNTSVTLYAKWTPALAIGDNYQGGKIAYIFQAGDAGYVAGETHGIIAATVNQSTGVVWAKLANQSSAVPGGTLSTIGSGATNTNNIITQNGLDSTYAAGIARSYAGGGYSDWYLPSLDELTKLFDAQAMIGNFTADYYWSSTEGGANTSWSKHFTGVSVSNQLKSTQWTYVRAIRSF